MSQISTRLITFFLNLLTARLLTIDAYGVRLFPYSGMLEVMVVKMLLKHDVRPSFLQLASVQFHLINTFILFLSREGFRRGCLRTQQSSTSQDLVARNVLAIASLSVALGVPITLCTCGFALWAHASWSDAYACAIYLQGTPTAT